MKAKMVLFGIGIVPLLSASGGEDTSLKSWDSDADRGLNGRVPARITIVAPPPLKTWATFGSVGGG